MSNNNQNNSYANFAEITIVGNLGKDFESKIVGQSKVASSSVAVNHKGDNAKTDWWTIEVWGNEGKDTLHNLVVNNGSTGRKVLVKGRPQIKEGSQGGTFPTIRVNAIEFLDKNPNANNNQGNQQQTAPYHPPQPPQNYNQAPQNYNYQAPPQGAPGVPPQHNYNQAPPVPPQAPPNYNQAPPNYNQAPPAPPMAPQGVPPMGAPAAPPSGYPQR